MITSSQTVRTHTQHSFSWHVCPFTLNFGFVTEGGGLQVTENCAKRSPQLLSVRSWDAVQPRHDAEMRSSVQSLRFQKMTGKFSGAPPPSAAPSSPSSSLGGARTRSQPVKRLATPHFTVAPQFVPSGPRRASPERVFNRFTESHSIVNRMINQLWLTDPIIVENR